MKRVEFTLNPSWHVTPGVVDVVREIRNSLELMCVLYQPTVFQSFVPSQFLCQLVDDEMMGMMRRRPGKVTCGRNEKELSVIHI